MMMTLPYLFLEASCDKVLNVGDVFIHGIFFPLKYLSRQMCLFVDFYFLQCLLHMYPIRNW